MSRVCVVCGAAGAGVHVFAFPRSHQLRAQWLTQVHRARPALRLPQVAETLSKVGVCEKHFLPGDIKKGRRKSLQHKAVPLLPPPTSPQDTATCLLRDTGQDTINHLDSVNQVHEPSCHLSHSVRSLQDDAKQDMYMITDGTNVGVTQKPNRLDMWGMADHSSLSVDMSEYLKVGQGKSTAKEAASESKVNEESSSRKEVCVVCGSEGGSSTLACVAGGDSDECAGVLARVVSRPKADLATVNVKICSRCTNLLEEVKHIEEDLRVKKQVIRNMYNTTFNTHFASVNYTSIDEPVSIITDNVECKSKIDLHVQDRNADLQVLEKGRELVDGNRKSSRRQASSKQFCCPQCKEVFTSLALWVQHSSKHQESEDPPQAKPTKPAAAKAKRVRANSHVCEECGEKFECKQTLMAHSTTHKKSTECNVCGRYLTTKARLKAHLFKFHGVGDARDKEVKCGECGKCFGTKAGLRYHRNVVHQVGTKYVCKHCNKTFFYHVLYRSHLLHAHGERKIVCETCGEKFFTVSKLNMHINAVHRSAESWTCEGCLCKFTTQTAYRHHMNVKHLKIMHTCDYCSAQFRKKSSLLAHLWKHSVFLCHLCQVSLANPEEYKTHMSCVHGRNIVLKGKIKPNVTFTKEKNKNAADPALKQKPDASAEMQTNEHVASIVINDLIMSAEPYDNSSLQSFALSACDKLPEKQKSLDIIDATQELRGVEHMQFNAVETLEIKPSPDHIEMPTGVSLINVQILSDMEISQAGDLGDLKGTMLADAAEHLTHDGQMDSEDNVANQLRVEMHRLSEEDLAVEGDLSESNHTLEASSHLDSSCHLKVEDLGNSCHLEAPDSLSEPCHLETTDSIDTCCALGAADGACLKPQDGVVASSSQKSPSLSPQRVEVRQLEDSVPVSITEEPEIPHLTDPDQCSLPAIIRHDEMSSDLNIQVADQVEDNLGDRMEDISHIGQMDTQMVEVGGTRGPAIMNPNLPLEQELSRDSNSNEQNTVLAEGGLTKSKMEAVELEPFSMSLDGKCEVQYQYVMYISAEGEDTQPD